MKALLIARDDRKLIKSSKPSALHKVSGVSLVEILMRKLNELSIEIEIFFIDGKTDEIKKQLGFEELCIKYDVKDFSNESIGESYVIIDSTMANVEFSDIDLGVDDAGINIISSTDDLGTYAKKKIYVLGKEPARTLMKNMKTDFADLDSDVCELVEIYNTNHIDILECEKMIAVNNMSDLYYLRSSLNRKKLFELMNDGVIIHDINSTYIDMDVKIGSDTEILPNSILEGSTVIGRGCIIGPSARIKNSMINDFITVKDSTITDSKVDDNTNIGPYAYLRPKSDIGKNVKVGDFVEVKNARISDNSKVSHLSYIGDGYVGENVNIGCGVVFVNYNGKEKNKTVVEDNSFIGCNVNLVAPVTVKKGAYVAAGSTITDEVPEDSLGIARCRQTNKLEWAKNK